MRQKGTRAEIGLRKALHAKGLRYRLQVPILAGLRRTADIVFPRARIAIFVDGCFWHGCPEHCSWPKRNADFWREKIEANRSRDADTDRRLNALGWTTVRLWEHEDPGEVANWIAALVHIRKGNDAVPCL